MSLISWEDLVSRHPKVSDLGGTNQVGSSHLIYAEAFLNSQLAPYYTVPFSGNNLTAKDLVIDIAYYRIYGYKDEKKSKALRDDVMERIKSLKDGSSVMITSSGEALSASNIGGALWSNTQNYAPTFGMIDEIDQLVDVDLLEDEYNDRGYS